MVLNNHDLGRLKKPKGSFLMNNVALKTCRLNKSFFLLLKSKTIRTKTEGIIAIFEVIVGSCTTFVQD